MAKLTRVTKRGCRSVTLAEGELIGMYGHGTELRSVKINFGCHCDEIDNRYEYNVSLSRSEIVRLATVSLRVSEIDGNLTAEEFAEWLRLSKKAMSQKRADAQSVP